MPLKLFVKKSHSSPAQHAKFRVFVECASNGLFGSVDVISLTQSSAKRFALQTFFRGKGWRVVAVEKIQ